MLRAQAGRGEARLLGPVPIPVSISSGQAFPGTSLRVSPGGSSVGLAGDRLERSLAPPMAWSGRPPPVGIPEPRSNWGADGVCYLPEPAVTKYRRWGLQAIQVYVLAV